MNTQIIITTSTFVGAGRQPTSSLAVSAVSANPLTASSGTSLGRVRTVSGNASKHMFERWQFHTARSANPSDLKRVRTVNKKAGHAILNRRKAQPADSTKLASSVLGGCPLVAIEPVKFFPEYRDSKKVRAKGPAACADNYIPKLWMAAAF